MEFKDILYEERDSVAYIAINRPDVMNAFRGQTVEELLQAFMKAGWDKRIAAIVLTGTVTVLSAPAAISRLMPASTTAAAPSASRWKNSTAPFATCPSP